MSLGRDFIGGSKPPKQMSQEERLRRVSSIRSALDRENCDVYLDVPTRQPGVGSPLNIALERSENLAWEVRRNPSTSSFEVNQTDFDLACQLLEARCPDSDHL